MLTLIMFKYFMYVSFLLGKNHVPYLEKHVEYITLSIGSRGKEYRRAERILNGMLLPLKPGGIQHLFSEKSIAFLPVLHPLGFLCLSRR